MISGELAVLYTKDIWLYCSVIDDEWDILFTDIDGNVEIIILQESIKVNGFLNYTDLKVIFKIFFFSYNNENFKSV